MRSFIKNIWRWARIIGEFISLLKSRKRKWKSTWKLAIRNIDDPMETAGVPVYVRHPMIPRKKGGPIYQAGIRRRTARKSYFDRLSQFLNITRERNA